MAVTVHYVGFHPTLILEGFEAVRVKEPIERVYILFDGKSDKRDRYRAVSQRNAAKLAKALAFFKPVKLPVNPLSYTSVFSRLYSILYYELKLKDGEGRGVRVYIDVTDMPPLMAAAAGAVAMMFENVEVYSVVPEVRGEFIPDPRTPEFDDWVEQKDSSHAQEVVRVPLPGRRARVAPDSERKLKILLTLHRLNGSAESVVDLMRACGDDPERNPAAKAAYSRLLKEMEDEGLIEKEQEGRSRRVQLTDFGKALVKALVRGEEMAERAWQPAPEKVKRPLRLQ
jgi:DNA-binding transcriptional ArsR family regulator